MITWATVWVLTVTQFNSVYGGESTSNYQLNYATYDICSKQIKSHTVNSGYFKKVARCDFQQIPVVKK